MCIIKRCHQYKMSCWKVKVEVIQLCPILCDTKDYTVPGILQARILEWVAVPFSRGSSHNPGIEPKSLPAEPPGKSKITGVGSLSLLQQTFLTQKLNQSLLHCRQILYGLSYRVSPSFSDKWHIDQLYLSFIIDALGFILKKGLLKNIYLCTIISVTIHLLMDI